MLSHETHQLEVSSPLVDTIVYRIWSRTDWQGLEVLKRPLKDVIKNIIVSEKDNKRIVVSESLLSMKTEKFVDWNKIISTYGLE